MRVGFDPIKAGDRIPLLGGPPTAAERAAGWREFQAPAGVVYWLDLGPGWAGAFLVGPGGFAVWHPGGRRYKVDSRGCKGPVTVRAMPGDRPVSNFRLP